MTKTAATIEFVTWNISAGSSWLPSSPGSKASSLPKESLRRTLSSEAGGALGAMLASSALGGGETALLAAGAGVTGPEAGAKGGDGPSTAIGCRRRSASLVSCHLA
eukprot:12187490-Alexandrium_andersonii.AAC.2